MFHLMFTREGLAALLIEPAAGEKYRAEAAFLSKIAPALMVLDDEILAAQDAAPPKDIKSEAK